MKTLMLCVGGRRDEARGENGGAVAQGEHETRLAAYAAQRSLFIHCESLGENRKTKPPCAIFGIKRRARAWSIAGQPRLRPDPDVVTYGAPCTTTPRASARSLNRPDTPC